ncbi:MAG: glycerol-3-phosphate 1-O-acyltransferase PlsY [Bacilli bacterium]|nr:glycerol-3-phosphate 1-O-acyltransferase PlsY [Bacilli bacterium]
MDGLFIQITFLIISYLLGSIPWALIIGKLVKGIDIREHGSKNMGATNAFRVLGFKYGLLVFALDALKGGIILFIMKHNFFNFDLGDFVIHPLAYGATAFLGHLFPIFAKFKGGKGMATASGIVLFYHPIAFAFGLLTFLIVIITTRFVSLSSCVTAIAVLITSFFYKDNYYITIGDITITYFSIILIFICTFLIVKHIPNFKRILKHTETKINFKAINDPKEKAFLTEDEEKEIINKTK